VQAERALITGGTAGIGFHVAEALARLGMEVVVTGRDAERGASSVAELQRHSRGGAISFLASDASSVRDCHALAAQVGALDVLVANAGGMWGARAETGEGLERTLAANFVAPIALTRALLPTLQRSRSPRVVHVVSSALEWWRGSDAFADVDSRQPPKLTGEERENRALELADALAARVIESLCTSRP
jgi:NAD(P)-dependent dehydrogenase (short-subunit alcohol dehydrogenase family)